jgi:hypothetical protein
MNKYRITLSLLFLSLLLLGSSSVLAQTHQHGSMPSGDGKFNPFVASGNGGFYLVYVERRSGASNVMLRHSADGKSFSVPVRVNDREGDAAVRNENPPKVIVSPKGEVYVCWANERAKWKGDIRFARSTDGGKTFSRAVTLNSDAGREPTGHAFQSIAVDRKGRIYVAWIDERNKTATDRGAEIWMSASTDGGRTFSRDRKILSDVCECCRSNIQVDSAGRIFLSYRVVPASGPMYRDIILARSDDGGNSFTTTVVSKDGWEINACPVAGPSLVIDEAGRVTVIWFTGIESRPGLYYVSSSNGGKSFSERKLLDPNQKMGKHAQAATRPDGKLFVAWDDMAQKHATAWGILDPLTGALRKIEAREGVSYPTVARNNRVALIAGMNSATRDVFLHAEEIE